MDMTLRIERSSNAQEHLPSTKVLKLVFELDGLGHRHAICTAVNVEAFGRRERLTLGDFRASKLLFDDDVSPY
jgi:hypothetical protein